MTAPGPLPGAAGARTPVGTLVEEAAQLLDALAVRLSQARVTMADHGPDHDGPGHDGPDHDDLGHDDLDHDDPVGAGPVVPDAAERPAGPTAGHLQCVGWCPVCRSADLLRGDRPEVAAALVDSAIVVISALRSLLPGSPATDHPTADHSTADHPTAGRAAGPPTEVPTDGTPPPGIERIDIR